jgi:SAM-dependent methyltransferase
VVRTRGTAAGSPGFVPEGARAWWPFVVGTAKAYQPPPWNAHLLLGYGLAQAVLRAQPTEPRENWRHFPREFLAALMHKEGAGREHPSRAFVSTLIRPGETVLDVGCGAGAGYESLHAAGRGAGYVGVDSSEPSIDVARELYPEAVFRVGHATTLVADFGRHSFDIVLFRHVLEHMPDFEAAMREGIHVSRRLAIFVFYLTPRALPFGVRKLDPGHNRPQFYTYVYSRSAIERVLARLGLSWEWHHGLGVSRAGWFANEVNSALIVHSAHAV